MTPRLLVITPPCGPAPTTVIEVARHEGVELALLLREPGADPHAVLEQDARLSDVRRAALGAGVPVFISASSDELDRVVGPARSAGLRGVQIKGDPGPQTILRARSAWPDAVLGASVHGAARPVTADYVVFAPVFAPRTSATFPKKAAGLDALRAWADQAPVFALGGIDADNASLCLDAGAYGVAGISTFLGTRATVTETLRALARVLAQPRHVPPSPRG